MKKLSNQLIIKKVTTVLVLLFFSFSLFAQSPNNNDLELMRSSGKIYVVVAVCLTILFGLIIYVFMLDRKISKMEKENL